MGSRGTRISRQSFNRQLLKNNSKTSKRSSRRSPRRSSNRTAKNAIQIKAINNINTTNNIII